MSWSTPGTWRSCTTRIFCRRPYVRRWTPSVACGGRRLPVPMWRRSRSLRLTTWTGTRCSHRPQSPTPRRRIRLRPSRLAAQNPARQRDVTGGRRDPGSGPVLSLLEQGVGGLAGQRMFPVALKVFPPHLAPIYQGPRTASGRRALHGTVLVIGPSIAGRTGRQPTAGCLAPPLAWLFPPSGLSPSAILAFRACRPLFDSSSATPLPYPGGGLSGRGAS